MTVRADKAVLILEFYLLILELKRDLGRLPLHVQELCVAKGGAFSAQLSCGAVGQLKMLG